MSRYLMFRQTVLGNSLFVGNRSDQYSVLQVRKPLDNLPPCPCWQTSHSTTPSQHVAGNHLPNGVSWSSTLLPPLPPQEAPHTPSAAKAGVSNATKKKTSQTGSRQFQKPRNAPSVAEICICIYINFAGHLLCCNQK